MSDGGSCGGGSIGGGSGDSGGCGDHGGVAYHIQLVDPGDPVTMLQGLVCQPQPFGAFFHAGGPLSYPTSYPAVVDVSQPAYPSGVVTVPVVAGSPYQARVLADPRALHQSNRKATVGISITVIAIFLFFLILGLLIVFVF